MTKANTAAYYQQRQQKERELAARATDPQIAKIHNDLADNYSRLAEMEQQWRREGSAPP